MNEDYKILVVDDELGIRESCRKVLSAEGFRVETAEDGAAGLERFRQEGGFAAALIDLKMPRMGGIELIEKIRQEDEDILLLVITAYATIETAVEATKLGAYGYIAKPFTPEELLLPVKNGLEKRALAIEARQLRREREQRLLEVAFERSRSATIINCMSDGTIVVNLDGQIVLRNAAAARALPWIGREALPCGLEALACQELRDLLRETVQPQARPAIVSREITLEKTTFMVNASAVIDQEGTVLGGLAVLRDISALKALSTAKSMFVSMVAHELKSPLAAIESYLGLLVDSPVDPEQSRKMLNRSLIRARTLRQLVDEMMSLRALEAGRFAISRAALHLREVLQGAVEDCREAAARKEITLALSRSDKPEENPAVLADREAMKRVFVNLIENAVKYTPAKGSVSVRLQRSGEYLQVEVRDSGIGMTAEEQEQVFDEFYRVRNKFTASVAGTGLGLSLVKSLVDMHQGKIQLTSTPGDGSVFTVSIPLA